MKAHEMEMADYMRRRGDGVIWCTIRLRHQEADVWICMGQEQGVSGRRFRISSGHWIPARRPRLGSDFAEVIPFLRSRECPDYNAMVISLCHGLPIWPLSTGHEHRGRRETIILQAPPHV